MLGAPAVVRRAGRLSAACRPASTPPGFAGEPVVVVGPPVAGVLPWCWAAWWPVSWGGRGRGRDLLEVLAEHDDARRRRPGPSRGRRAGPRRRGTRARARAFVLGTRRVADLGDRVVGAIGVGGRRRRLETGATSAPSAVPAAPPTPEPFSTVTRTSRARSSGPDRAGVDSPAQPGEHRRGLARRRGAARSGRRGSRWWPGSVYIGNAFGSGLRNANTSARRSEAFSPLVAGQARRRSCRRPC